MKNTMYPCLAILVAMVSNLAAGSSGAVSPPVEIMVPSAEGELRAMRFPITLTDTQFNRTGVADIVYVPKTGFAWTGGGLYEGRVVALEDRILGFWYLAAGNINRLTVSDSTNRYERELKDTSSMVQTELEQFRVGRWRYGGDPSYGMRLEEILGPGVMRDKYTIEEWPDTNAFSHAIRPSRFQSLTVEGTNAVVAIEIQPRMGTNILAKIAFDKDVRPVWATTNGVSIGPIPTNTVYYIEIQPDGHGKLKVVY